MTEQTNGDSTKENVQVENSWTFGPKDFIFKYLKYLPWVLVCAAIGVALAYVKLRYSVPIYRTQSSLLIKDEHSHGSGGGDKDQRFDELFMNQSTANLSNETAILKSRPVLKRVAKDLGLQVTYYNQGSLRSSFLYPNTPIEVRSVQNIDSAREFSFLVMVLNEDQFTLNDDKTAHSFGQPFSWSGNQLTLVRKKEIDLKDYGSAKFQVNWRSIQQATEYLLGGLKVSQIDAQATILSLSFDNENTLLGINVLNTLMSVYDSLIIEDKNRIAINTENFIDTRLTSLRADLNGIEGKLKGNMEQNQTFDIEDQSKKYFDEIAEGDKKLIELEVRLKVVDLLSEYIGNKGNIHKLVPTSLGIEEPVLLQFVTEYNRMQLEREANLRTTSANNALIVGLDNSLEKLRKDIIEALQNVKNAYQIAYNRLKQEEEGMKSELKTLPGKSLQFLNVQRQQKILEELYSFLLQKKIENSISSASTISYARVLEPALALNDPISPDRSKIYTFNLLMGLIIPIGFIFLLELLKDKVSSRMEVESSTKAPILGEIGHSEETKTSLVVTQNSRSLIAEQFRIVRTNLQYVAGRKERTTILVTSSFSGEGKSFVSTNMGAVMALSGKKTVIMEFDIRKPKIVSGLDLKRKMGISNYIIGKATFNELLVKVNGADNLYVIPCGPIPPNPAEILLDTRLDELMEEVKANFEVVIMDTAPVGLVSDAISLSRFADCTLYVIRQGYTFRKQLRFINELYIAKKLPSLSILLNDVQAGSSYYGGYGYYGGGYGYGASSGYFEDDSLKKSNKSAFKRLMDWWKRK
ncbi:MAG TPA: polysaccharide biosynthesis tyrosine autokinase [Puia sp.]|nr:polysaccharide biosynthesis tyrosine autokinase [Puia sp.]